MQVGRPAKRCKEASSSEDDSGRERNRQAAQIFRQRDRQYVEQLQQTAAELESKNTELSKLRQMLLAERDGQRESRSGRERVDPRVQVTRQDSDYSMQPGEEGATYGT